MMTRGYYSTTIKKLDKYEVLYQIMELGWYTI